MVTNKGVFSILSDDEAQGLVEYSLILSLIALAVLLTLVAFGGALLDLYRDVILDKVEEI